MKSWHPPLILLALILPAAAGFAIGGPGFGIMLAGFCLVGLVVIVLRMVPDDPIGMDQHQELKRRLLVVTTFPIAVAGTRVRSTPRPRAACRSTTSRPTLAAHGSACVR